MEETNQYEITISDGVVDSWSYEWFSYTIPIYSTKMKI